MIMNKDMMENEITALYDRIDFLKNKIKGEVIDDRQKLINVLLEKGFDCDGNTFTKKSKDGKLIFSVYLLTNDGFFKVIDGIQGFEIVSTRYIDLKPLIGYINSDPVFRLIRKTYNVEEYIIPDRDLEEDKADFESINGGKYEIIETYHVSQ